MRFSRLLIGDTFKLNNVEYTKTNHSRGWRVESGRKVFLHVKKDKEVEPVKTALKV